MDYYILNCTDEENDFLSDSYRFFHKGVIDIFTSSNATKLIYCHADGLHKATIFFDWYAEFLHIKSKEVEERIITKKVELLQKCGIPHDVRYLIKDFIDPKISLDSLTHKNIFL